MIFFSMIAYVLEKWEEIEGERESKICNREMEGDRKNSSYVILLWCLFFLIIYGCKVTDAENGIGR